MKKPCIALMLPGRPGCRLDLNGGARSVSYHGSDIRDSIRDLVLAAVDLARGRGTTMFAWWSEPGGVFVDISLGQQEAALVVHEMRDPDWSAIGWFPERGPALFRLAVPAGKFINDFFGAVVGLSAQAEASPRPVWGHALPHNLIDEIRHYLELGFQAEFTAGGETR